MKMSNQSLEVDEHGKADGNKMAIILAALKEHAVGSHVSFQGFKGFVERMMLDIPRDLSDPQEQRRWYGWGHEVIREGLRLLEEREVRLMAVRRQLEPPAAVPTRGPGLWLLHDDRAAG